MWEKFRSRNAHTPSCALDCSFTAACKYQIRKISRKIYFINAEFHICINMLVSFVHSWFVIYSFTYSFAVWLPHYWSFVFFVVGVVSFRGKFLGSMRKTIKFIIVVNYAVRYFINKTRCRLMSEEKKKKELNSLYALALEFISVVLAIYFTAKRVWYHTKPFRQ